MNTDHLTDEHLNAAWNAYRAARFRAEASGGDAMRAALATLPEPQPAPVVLPKLTEEDRGHCLSVARAAGWSVADLAVMLVLNAYRDRLAARIPHWHLVPPGATIKAGVRVRRVKKGDPREAVEFVTVGAYANVHEDYLDSVLSPDDYTLPDPDAKAVALILDFHEGTEQETAERDARKPLAMLREMGAGQ